MVVEKMSYIPAIQQDYKYCNQIFARKLNKENKDDIFGKTVNLQKPNHYPKNVLQIVMLYLR